MSVSDVRGCGRFAPSPSGLLHLGNLRTALLAWLYAKSTGRDCILRIDDLDAQRAQFVTEQRKELALLGLTFDGGVRFEHASQPQYEAAFEQLKARDLVYECFCTRREIHEATRAPNGTPFANRDVLIPPGAYPGTCRNLTAAQCAQRRRERPPAWRLKVPEGTVVTVHDERLGDLTGIVDDFVLRRNDGQFAYNFAVVIDDATSGVDQIVRGDDLVTSTPRQAYLYDVLQLLRPTWIHVPLVLNADGRRLQKRDGAVTLEALAELGWRPQDVCALLARSLGLEGDTPDRLLQGFDHERIPSEPLTFANVVRHEC